MSRKTMYIAVETVLVTILLLLPIVRSSDEAVVPADKSQLNSWFEQNVGPISARTAELDPALSAAEANVTVIKIKADGSGDFKTIGDAVKSVPTDNKNRVVISIGPGTYNEKIKVEMYKPFITLSGDPASMPTIVASGTALQFGTMDSATLAVESEYFVAANLNIVNSAPRPDGIRKGAQAAAMRISADKAAFYNCKFKGFQDTLCDDAGKHFFKDCYVEGTVDFIFGNGRSLYMNSELHVIPGDQMAMIAAHSRKAADEPSGYSFVHCTVTGEGQIGYLARAWFPFARVIYSYSDMSDAINPEGWFNTKKGGGVEGDAVFGEYNNKGPGAAVDKRVTFMKKLTDAEAKPFISLGHIEASKWLLPPPKV